MTSRARAVERYTNWQDVRERMSELRLAGYHSQATDMGRDIWLTIDGGKRGRALAQLPPRKK